MPSPLSIDVLPTIDALVDNNASREQIVSLGAQQIRRLREDLRAGANATPEQQRKLERLQAVIGTRIALIEAVGGVSDIARKEIVAELRTLREVMDKRFILPDYAPDAPDAVRKTLQFTAGSLDVGIRTLNAATRDLPPAARVGILAGAGVATVLAVKWLWNELGVIGKTVATGVAGTMGFLGFQKLQENWTAIGGFMTDTWSTVRGWLPNWLTNVLPSQSTSKLTAEDVKKLEEQRQNQEKTTTDALSAARGQTGNPNLESLVGTAIRQIETEIGQVQQILASPTTSADRQILLKARIAQLEKARSEMTGLIPPQQVKKLADDAAKKKIQEVKEQAEKLKETHKQVMDVLTNLPDGPFLTNTAQEIVFGNITLIRRPDALYVRKNNQTRRVNIAIITSQQPPVTHILDLRYARKFETRIGFSQLPQAFVKYAGLTSNILIRGLPPPLVSGDLVQAIIAFQGDRSAFEKPIPLIGKLRIALV